jgi:antitoxin (DNA-binding transcriptional repressor) of toxin-antitoxin stability system
MAEMESVGIREFRANLHKYTVERDAPITVTSHGEAIGYYIPVRPSPQSKDFDALKKAAKQISDMLRQSGVSEDEIVADFQKARSHTSQA